MPVTTPLRMGWTSGACTEKQRSGGDGDVTQTHRGDLGDHLVQDRIAVAKVVVEGDRRAVLQSTSLDGGANAGEHLARPRHGATYPNARARDDARRGWIDLGAKCLRICHDTPTQSGAWPRPVP